MMAVEDPPAVTPGLFGRILAGTAGGLAGGVGFGILMHATDTIPMVAQLVDRDSLLVGWAVHMSIAVFVGITHALVFGLFAVGLPISTVLGVFYGLVWWVLGGLTLMPLRLGLGLFVFDTAAWQSLAGHLAYGAALGVVYAVVCHLLLNAQTPRARAFPGTVDLPSAVNPAGAAAADSSVPVQTMRPQLPAAPAPPSTQGSILEFILSAESPQAPPPPSRGTGLTPLSPEARALRQHPEPAPWPSDVEIDR